MAYGKKWIWRGVWALPRPPGQAKPIPARATSRGRSEASWVPWNHPIPPKKNYLPKSKTVTFVSKKNVVQPTLQGGPFVKVSYISQKQYYSPQQAKSKFVSNKKFFSIYGFTQEGGIESKCANNKRWGPHMVLASNFFRSPTVWSESEYLEKPSLKSGNPNFRIRMNWEGSEIFIFTY